MRLWLTPTQTNILVQQAVDDAPRETCGLLAGLGERVQEIVPLPNSAVDPLHHYRLNDQAYSTALFRLQAKNLTVVGFYHSHPKGDPIPSVEDIQDAHYPDTPYLIIGLRNGESRLAAWRIRYGQVVPVEIYVGEEAPPPEEGTLSMAQKRAIILSAIIVFVFMIILSLSLLPPAPMIVTPVP
jgi:proteasome lid subunit RPN8/RPN11